MGRGKSKAAAAREQMPLCTYGSACARGKDCIYRHPKPTATAAVAAAAAEPTDAGVCMAHVAGGCAFGKNCRKLHVSEDEAAALRTSCARRPCMFGASCASPLCLYLHPAQAAERALEMLALEDGKVDDLLPPRARPQTVVAPAPLPLPLRASAPARGAPSAPLCVPDALWIDASARADAFGERDPLERFRLVNAPHGRSDVLDLHFQSTASFRVVLDSRLGAAVRAAGDSGAWVLTGSGHHVPQQSHQARGGLLFETVGAYLRECVLQGADWGFAPASDRNGHLGAYNVWPLARR